MFKKLPKYNDKSYTHFVTTVTADRFKYFKDDKYCQILVDNIKFYQIKYKLEIPAYAIMPDHLHILIWWDGDLQPELEISKIIQGIKGSTARQIIDHIESGLRWPEQRLRPNRWNDNLDDQDLKQRLRLNTEKINFDNREASREPQFPTLRLNTEKINFDNREASREPQLPTGIKPQLPTASHKRNLKYQIWQPGFYDFNIYSDYKLEEKINYIKNNPVKAGLTLDWQEYQWVSID
jgi:REP element-mobilizing transposase RayT